MAESIGLGILGVFVGAFGTLIGAGGGFILLPVLALLYPHESPEALASLSLTTVFFNALSGSAGYARLRQIDYRSGLMFAIAAVPGAAVGALTTRLLDRTVFNVILASVMLLGSILLFGAAGARAAAEAERHRLAREQGGSVSVAQRPSGPRLWMGLALAFAVGFVSSLLGIGGGIIHVPGLVFVLDFPIHVATATSHFVLAITALVGAGVHDGTGGLHGAYGKAAALAIGVVVGAQIGAHMSRKTAPVVIVRSLAVALALVAVRILWTSLRGRL